MPDNGITGSYQAEGPTSYVIIVFLSVAIYNVIELTPIIWTTFKRHSGLYFWSFIVATYGILIYSVGFLLKSKVNHMKSAIYVALIAIGWVSTVTGQSMVLWSRLHLVLHDRFKLKLILWMIIVDAVLMHTPIVIFLHGTNSSDPDRWVKPYTVYEKIQVTVFFIQEIIISAVYISETLKLMRLSREIQNGNKSRQLMNHLILVNIVIIFLDITILGLEYAGLYNIQTSYKALVYSVKLKLEFTILNRLVEMTTGKRDSASDSRSGGNHGTKPDGDFAASEGINNIRLDPIRCAAMRRPPSVAYRAHVRGSSSASRELERYTADGTADRSRDVVLTTEIVVQREARTHVSDGMSISDDSYTPRGDPGSQGELGLPKSSSELNLTAGGP